MPGGNGRDVAQLVARLAGGQEVGSSSLPIPTMSASDEDVLYCHRCQAEIVDDDWYFFHGVFWCYECREHIARQVLGL